MWRESQTIYYALVSPAVQLLIGVRYDFYCRPMRRRWRGKEQLMSIDRAVMALAGTMILVSLVLSQIHSVYWLALTAFVGLKLLQASFTGFCPAATVFKRLGLKPGCAFS